MSNLTIGKIANNSMTLVLKSVLHVGLGNDNSPPEFNGCYY